MQQETRALPENTPLGVGLIMASVLLMALADALVKLVSADFTLWQIYVLRSLFAIPVLVILLAGTGTGFRVKSVGWVYLRSLLLVLMWIAYYGSLPVLSLPVAAVALYTSPLMIALLSGLLIGEPVGSRRWIGASIGFVGVLAILRPGTETFSWFTLLPLLGAFFYALAMVLTRSKCSDEAPLALSLALNISLMVTGLIATASLALWHLTTAEAAIYPFVLNSWTTMGSRDWQLVAVLGVMIVAYSVGVAKAYQIAAPSVVATFDYTYLVSAAVWSFVLFADLPDTMTFAGMLLITIAGVLVLKAPDRLPQTELP